MYEWLVVFGMKNGHLMRCIYKGDKTDSIDVLEEMLQNGTNEDLFGAFLSEDGKTQICIRLADISTIQLSPFYPNAEKENNESEQKDIIGSKAVS